MVGRKVDLKISKSPAVKSEKVVFKIQNMTNDHS
jgi:hypothetical protein